MRVLVTGGAGRVGRATTERLVKNGWDVRVIGLEEGMDAPGVEFVKCDIMNYDEVREQMRGCHAVVHLAAIASPGLDVGHKVFDVNVSGTFHVFEAAAAEGIRKISHASSINALGCTYNLGDFVPKYFPIDEAHPNNTSDPYSFAKGLVEEIGEYYWRRDGIASVALRFTAVTPRDMLTSEGYIKRRETTKRVLDELLTLPPAEAKKRLDAVKESVVTFRKGRGMEWNDGPPKRPNIDDPLWAIYNLDRYTLWSVIDERDAAQSLEKGITADYEGGHALFINDDHNSMGYDSKTLVQLFFPEVSESVINVAGDDALLSIDKARNLIGFEPEYSVKHWQD